MRMWLVNPRVLCKKHLLGEHVEMHMFVGSIKKNISMSGYASTGLVEIHNIKARHAQLVEEMFRRGIYHDSPLKDFVFEPRVYGYVDVRFNYWEIARRCERCRDTIAATLKIKSQLLDCHLNDQQKEELLQFIKKLDGFSDRQA